MTPKGTISALAKVRTIYTASRRLLVGTALPRNGFLHPGASFSTPAVESPREFETSEGRLSPHLTMEVTGLRRTASPGDSKCSPGGRRCSSPEKAARAFPISQCFRGSPETLTLQHHVTYDDLERVMKSTNPGNFTSMRMDRFHLRNY